jgi:hypothetical protein
MTSGVAQAPGEEQAHWTAATQLVFDGKAVHIVRQALVSPHAAHGMHTPCLAYSQIVPQIQVP